MYTKKAADNISNWMDSTTQVLIEDEQWPMLLLTYKELPNRKQNLLIHRGSEYTNAQIIEILETFIDSIKKAPTNGK
jgi:hypothetical protein